MKLFGKSFDYSKNEIADDGKVAMGKTEDEKENIGENINEKLENYKRNIKKQK